MRLEPFTYCRRIWPHVGSAEVHAGIRRNSVLFWERDARKYGIHSALVFSVVGFTKMEAWQKRGAVQESRADETTSG